MIINKLLFILLFGFVACNNKPQNKPHVHYENIEKNAEVLISAGDVFPSFDLAGIPTFFNVAQMDPKVYNTCMVLLPGERIRRGKKIAVKPIALLKFRKDTIDYSFVIANNFDNNSVGIKSQTYSDFSVKDSKVKSLLENWILSNCELGQCSEMVWQNDYQANMLVQNKIIKPVTN